MTSNKRKTTHRWHTGFEGTTHAGSITGASGWGHTDEIDIVDAANRPKTAAAGSLVMERAHVALGDNTSCRIEVGLPGTAVQYHHAIYTRDNIDEYGLFVPVADGKKMRIEGTDVANSGSASFEGFSDYPQRIIGPRTIPTGDFTIVAGNPVTVNTKLPHKLVTGDRVRFVDNTSDATELVTNNGFRTVTVTDADSFTVPEDIAAAVQDGTIEIWSRSFPTLDDEGVLLCEERTAADDNKYVAVARIEPGERIIISGIHLSKHETNTAGRYAELVLARNLTMTAGLITAPNDGAEIDHEIIMRSSHGGCFLPCHIELGGNHLFTGGAVLPGANGCWILLRNEDSGGAGGGADASCMIQYTKVKGHLGQRSFYKFGSTATSTTLFTVPAGARVVLRHVMLDNLANTESTLWWVDAGIPDAPACILGSRSAFPRISRRHLRIHGGASGAQINLTTTGAGECRAYIDGYYEKLA